MLYAPLIIIGITFLIALGVALWVRAVDCRRAARVLERRRERDRDRAWANSLRDIQRHRARTFTPPAAPAAPQVHTNGPVPYVGPVPDGYELRRARRSSPVPPPPVTYSVMQDYVPSPSFVESSHSYEPGPSTDTAPSSDTGSSWGGGGGEGGGGGASGDY